MSSDNQPLTYDRNFAAKELLIDHRKQLAFEEEERAKQRALQLEELRSAVNSPSVRIRAWEKLYGLRLPTSPTHPILKVISSSTGISLAALREEQQARRGRQVAPRPGEHEAGDG